MYKMLITVFVLACWPSIIFCQSLNTNSDARWAAGVFAYTGNLRYKNADISNLVFTHAPAGATVALGWQHNRLTTYLDIEFLAATFKENRTAEIKIENRSLVFSPSLLYRFSAPEAQFIIEAGGGLQLFHNRTDFTGLINKGSSGETSYRMNGTLKFSIPSLFQGGNWSLNNLVKAGLWPGESGIRNITESLQLSRRISRNQGIGAFYRFEFQRYGNTGEVRQMLQAGGIGYFINIR